MSYEAINDHIVFQFEDNLDHRGQFVQKHEFLELPFGDHKDSASSPRWGVVVHAGPHCDESIKPGARILIENLKWTMAFQLEDDGPKFWRTDETCVLFVEVPDEE